MSAREGAELLKKLAEQNEEQKREDEAAIAAHHAAAAKASELPGEKGYTVSRPSWRPETGDEKFACGVMSGMATFAEAAIRDGYLDEIRAQDSFTVDSP